MLFMNTFPWQLICIVNTKHCNWKCQNDIGSIPNNQYTVHWWGFLTVVRKPVETPAARQDQRLFIWIQAQIRNAASFSVACNGLWVKGKALLAWLGCDTKKHIKRTKHFHLKWLKTLFILETDLNSILVLVFWWKFMLVFNRLISLRFSLAFVVKNRSSTMIVFADRINTDGKDLRKV